MTCLIATAEGVWADRRVTAGPSRFRPGRKVVRGDGLVAAFCGENAHCDKAARAVREGMTDPKEVAALCDGLLVDSRGVWELWGGCVEKKPAREPFSTHGSGFAEAQAFLSGAGAVDDATIRRALRYVARVRTDCGDGIDRLLLDSPARARGGSQ